MGDKIALIIRVAASVSEVRSPFSLPSWFSCAHTWWLCGGIPPQAQQHGGDTAAHEHHQFTQHCCSIACYNDTRLGHGNWHKASGLHVVPIHCYNFAGHSTYISMFSALA